MYVFVNSTHVKFLEKVDELEKKLNESGIKPGRLTLL